MTNRETSRLLSVVLDGFGYAPLECGNQQEIYEKLSNTTPSAAVVDTRLEESQAICSMIQERGGVSLVVLLDDGEADPQKQMERYRADAWQPVTAGPERLLLTLKRLFVPENGAGPADGQ